MNLTSVKDKQGSIVLVSTGICVGNQTTQSAISHIKNADVVYAAVSADIGMAWLKTLNDNIVNLGDFYADDKSRVQTYREIVEAMVGAVESGLTVCGAFYGHVGFFAWAPHQTVKILRQKGYQAHLEAGVSALDCLVADLSLDPGEYGCLALETTQFLFYQHVINPHCMVVLWQVGLAGDYEFKGQQLDCNHRGLAILTEQLLTYYPSKHEVILYEAPVLAIEKARAEVIALVDLPSATVSAITTLVIPSIGLAPFNLQMLARFGIDEQQLLANLDGIASKPLDKCSIK